MTINASSSVLKSAGTDSGASPRRTASAKLSRTSLIRAAQVSYKRYEDVSFAIDRAVRAARERFGKLAPERVPLEEL